MMDREERDEAYTLGWQSGMDRDEINVCPYGPMDGLRRVWLNGYLAGNRQRQTNRSQVNEGTFDA